MLTRFFSVVAIVALSACASLPDEQRSDPDRDPNEGMNRAVFDFNLWVDRTFLRPVAITYRNVMPDPVEDGINNIFRNLAEPWTFVNDLLQGKPGRAGTTLARFLVNSTVGIGGLFKASDNAGIQHHTEDFGQTLETWGLPQGPYFVIPFIGPSTVQDTTGFIAAIFGDPTNLVLRSETSDLAFYSYLGAQIIVTRARLHPTLEQLYAERDPYTLARAAYFQNRNFQFRDGKLVVSEEDDDLFDDFDDEEGFE